MSNFKVTLTTVDFSYEYDSPEFRKTETLAILPSRTEAIAMQIFCNDTFTHDDYSHYVEETDEPVTHQTAYEWASTYTPLDYKERKTLAKHLEFAIEDAIEYQNS